MGGPSAMAGAGRESAPDIRYLEEAGVFSLGPFPAEVVQGLESGPSPEKVFQVRVATHDPDGPAMAGSYAWTKSGTLTFTPQFPLVPGLSYEARFLPLSLPEPLRNPAWQASTERFASPIAEDDSPPAELTTIYPTADRLPENLLKFYLHFSKPMSRGEAYEHIQLLDSENKIIPLPFLELGEELWDSEQRRFTLFFDPGRVKRGLKPHQEEGRPLQLGKQYTLVIKSSWKDAARHDLAKTYRKTFEALEADYTQPDPASWKFTLPAPTSRDALQVELGESLDHALLERVLQIEDADGRPVAGTPVVSQSETTWQWIPDSPWKEGAYALVIDSVLEDLAGNSLERPFEETEAMPLSSEIRIDHPTRRPFTLGGAH
jgi:hypothetical protein